MEEGRENEVGAEGGAGMGNRLKAYKYKRMDVKEMRRHREEEGLQLRKQKKDELVYFNQLINFYSQSAYLLHKHYNTLEYIIIYCNVRNTL